MKIKDSFDILRLKILKEWFFSRRNGSNRNSITNWINESSQDEYSILNEPNLKIKNDFEIFNDFCDSFSVSSFRNKIEP